MRPQLSTSLGTIVIVAGLLAYGCYKEDITGLPRARPLVTVLLTDSPFPFDSVASVNVYVDSIEASASLDSGTASWVTVAAPHATFDLLAVQQGTTAFVGQGTLSAGQYRAVRMTIDTDSSSILWDNGSSGAVHWPHTGRITLYAFVQPAFSVADSGTNIVLDFDVGLSFQYNLFGINQFEFTPWLRAVNAAATGAIAGIVTTSVTGSTLPVRQAYVTVYAGALPTTASTSSILATGHTDSIGHYRIAYLVPGTYGVVVTQPNNPFVASVGTPGVQITPGATTALSVSLPKAGAGNAYLHISGPTTVGVGGSIGLFAAVVDSNGVPVSTPVITWTSSDTAVASTKGFGAADTTYGRSAGFAQITASTMGMRDSLTIEVTTPGSVDTVASVTISPTSANVAVGDSVTFYATTRNASGEPLSSRLIAWFVSDTTIAQLYASGSSAILYPLRAGQVTLQATSEGKIGTAGVTVH